MLLLSIKSTFKESSNFFKSSDIFNILVGFSASIKKIASIELFLSLNLLNSDLFTLSWIILTIFEKSSSDFWSFQQSHNIFRLGKSGRVERGVRKSFSTNVFSYSVSRYAKKLKVRGIRSDKRWTHESLLNKRHSVEPSWRGCWLCRWKR